MAVKRIQLLAQIVGFVTIGVLSILGALTIASGGRPAWGALGQPPSTASSVASTVSSRVPVSNVINYQGILRDPDGTPVTGTYTMTFRLYNDPVVGTAVFTDTLQNVMTRDGLFTVLLGDSEGNEIGASLFGQPLYVGIQVEDNAEMAPRQRIAPVPYAVQLTDGVYVDGSGNVGIGTADPAVQLDVDGDVGVSGSLSVVGGIDASAMTIDGMTIGGRPLFKFFRMELPDNFRPTWGEPPQANTGVSADEYVCGLTGFNAGQGDINENGDGWLLGVQPYIHNGTWWINAGMRTHGAYPDWWFWVMCVDKRVAEQEVEYGLQEPPPR